MGLGSDAELEGEPVEWEGAPGQVRDPVGFSHSSHSCAELESERAYLEAIEEVPLLPLT